MKSLKPSDYWSTPPEVFEWCSKQFGPFDLDVCATAENTKAKAWLTERTECSYD